MMNYYMKEIRIYDNKLKIDDWGKMIKEYISI